MKDLWCYSNQLTSLDASGCTSLETLYAQMNKLNSLNVNNCSALRTVAIYYNNIKAGQMGQFVTSLATRSASVPGTLYVLADEYWDDEDFVEGNVMTASQVNQATAKYWNVYYAAPETGYWEPYAGSTFLRGDVNEDTWVDINDVTLLISVILGNNVQYNSAAADCNLDGGDGAVDINDVTVLINYVLNGNWPSKALAVNASPRTAAAAVKMLDEKMMEMEMPERLHIKRH